MNSSIMTINCPRCGTKMELFDNEDSDGNFSGWEWKCKCGYSEEDADDKY